MKNEGQIIFSIIMLFFLVIANYLIDIIDQSDTASRIHAIEQKISADIGAHNLNTIEKCETKFSLNHK